MILYIDTSDQKKVIVSLKKEGGEIVDSMEGEHQYGSQVLLPLIVELLEKNGVGYKDLTGIEVNEGPGSYTGLRVGASVGQALGYGLNIPVNGKLNQPVELKYG